MATQRKKAQGSGSGPETMQTVVSNAFRSQARSLEQGQGWVESTLSTLREQAESYANLLHSVQSSLQAMERAISAQAETTRALTESVDAARSVITTVATAQERGMRQAEGFFETMLDTMTAQMQALQAQVRSGQSLLTGTATAPDEFLKMAQDWTDAYTRLVDSAMSMTAGARRGDGSS